MSTVQYPFAGKCDSWVRCPACGAVWLPIDGAGAPICVERVNGGQECGAECRPLLPHEEAVALLRGYYLHVEVMPL